MKLSKAFKNSLSPFWICILSDGTIISLSDYFLNVLELGQSIFTLFYLKKVRLTKNDDLFKGLNNKIFQLQLKEGILFRANIHIEKKEGLLILWPLLEDSNDIKELSLEVEMSHPAAMTTDLLISRGVLSKKSERLNKLRLEKIERKYKYLFDQSQDAVMTLEPPSWNFGSGNPAALRLYNIQNNEEFSKHSLWTVSPKMQPAGEESRSLMNNYISQTIKEGINSFDWIHLPKGKSQIFCRIQLSRIIENDRVYLQAVVRDITTEKNLEIELRKTNEQLDLALENADLGIWNWNIREKTIEVDSRWISILGLESYKKTLDFKEFEKSIHPEDWSTFYSEMKKYKSGQQDKFEAVYRVKNYDSQWVFILSKGRFSAWDNSGSPIVFTGTHLDISSKIETEKALARNAKLASIGQLAAGVGHEINNPLAIVKGYVSKILRTNPLDIEEVRKNIEKIDAAATRIQNIVLGLRTFARIERNTEGHFFNINALLFEMENMLKEIYLNEGVSLLFKNVKVSEDVCLEGDRGKFEQVLLNLISNAKDSTRGQSQRIINVFSKVSAKSLVIKVIDNGHGIPIEISDKIFDPFFTTKEHGEGTGIGLSLAYKFIKDDFGGELWAYNHPGNQGAVFELEVPTLASLPRLRSPGKDGEIELKFKLNALLVEDEAEVGLLLLELLREIGLKVKLCKNGKLALQELESKTDFYQLIISDMKMPEMDGLTFLKKVRESKTIMQPKFFLTTGGVNENFEAQDNPLYKLIDGYFYKPFSKKVILELLKKNFLTIN